MEEPTDWADPKVIAELDWPEAKPSSSNPFGVPRLPRIPTLLPNHLSQHPHLSAMLLANKSSRLTEHPSLPIRPRPLKISAHATTSPSSADSGCSIARTPSCRMGSIYRWLHVNGENVGDGALRLRGSSARRWSRGGSPGLVQKSWSRQIRRNRPIPPKMQPFGMLRKRLAPEGEKDALDRRDGPLGLRIGRGIGR